MSYVYAFRLRIEFCSDRPRHCYSRRCGRVAAPGRIPCIFPRRQPRYSRRIFAGNDFSRVPGLPVGAPSRAEGMVKAILLAAAFLFWAANQYWPNLPEATLFNDIAIALFVLDVFLVMIGWPLASNDGVFSEAHGTEACRCDCGCCGGRGAVSQRIDALMGSLRDVEAGRHFTREEFNE